MKKINYTDVNPLSKKEAFLVKKEIINTIKKKENQDVLSVWDIDKDGWRSFRLDSIKEFKVVKGML